MYLFQFWHERWLKVCLKINNKQFEEYKLAFVRLFVVDAYIKKKKRKEITFQRLSIIPIMIIIRNIWNQLHVWYVVGSLGAIIKRN